MMNYSLGGPKGPGKSKKVKGKPTAEDTSKESKKKRLASFSKEDQKKVGQTLKINNQSQKAIDEGLQLNEYKLPAGDQKFKKYRSLIRGQKSKF